MFKKIVQLYFVFVLGVGVYGGITNVTYAEKNTFSNQIMNSEKIKEWQKEIEEKNVTRAH